MNNKFISPDTKRSIIVFSIIMILLSLVVVYMTTMQLEPSFVGDDLLANIFGSTAFVIGLITMLVSTIIYGAYLITVFIAYKRQNRLICVNGIIHISVVALMFLFIILIAISFASGKGFALYFYSVIFGAFACWQVAMGVLMLKNKQKTGIYQLVLGVLFLAFTVVLTIFFAQVISGEINDNTFVLIQIASGITAAITLMYAVTLLACYVVKDPTYLETPQGLEVLQEELARKGARINKANQIRNVINGPVPPVMVAPEPKHASDDVISKLEKLDALFKKNIITEEEYKAKKAKLLEDL